MRASNFAKLFSVVAAVSSVLSVAMGHAGPAGHAVAKVDSSAAPPAAKKIDPLDWPTWRGPEQNGISRETGLVTSWDAKSGKNLLWKSAELATRSTPIVMHGKLYTLASSYPGTHQEGEKVICADAATGKVLWENKFNVFLSDVPRYSRRLERLRGRSHDWPRLCDGECAVTCSASMAILAKRSGRIR